MLGDPRYGNDKQRRIPCPAIKSSVEASSTPDDVSRRNKWGQLGENLGGVKFPWCWQSPAV